MPSDLKKIGRAGRSVAKNATRTAGKKASNQAVSYANRANQRINKWGGVRSNDTRPLAEPTPMPKPTPLKEANPTWRAAQSGARVALWRPFVRR